MRRNRSMLGDQELISGFHQWSERTRRGRRELRTSCSNPFKCSVNQLGSNPSINQLTSHFSALEPILAALAIYMSFIYGVIYLLFEAYPFVFIQNHGFNVGEEGLTFFGIFGGGVLSVILCVPAIRYHWTRSSSTSS